jgi:hypothetical protein
MVAVISVILGIALWIAFATAAGTFIGHSSFRSLDDDGDQVDVR